jgi:hypothetical protein
VEELLGPFLVLARCIAANRLAGKAVLPPSQSFDSATRTPACL